MSANTGAIEQRSFDYVPEVERHGSVWSQTQFWFMINATIITALAGAVGASMGLGLAWSLVAILIGNVVGASFQAFHGNQGPHMGLPQMIQSRVQFGSRGALIPIVAAAIIQLGFGVFNLQTAAQSLGDITTPHMTLYQIGLGALAIAGATIGYRLILRIERFSSYFMVVNLILLTIAAFVVLPVGDLLASGNFVLVPFIAQIAIAASYQIALAPIISDMTRYLPSRIGTRAAVTSVFAGTLVSATWIEALGALVTVANPDVPTVTAIADMGNEFGFGLGTATLIIAVVVTTMTFAQGMYSGSISVLSALNAFRPMPSTGRLRFITLLLAGLAVLILSLTLPGDILTNFSVFLALLGYLLIPWTAVNLTDYYFIRKGRYSITDILRQDGGIYGRWNKVGLTSYAAGLLAMIPFISTAVWTGPIAAALDGADISFLIGFIVAGALYWALTRNLDLAAELRHVSAQPIHSLKDVGHTSSGPRSAEEPNQEPTIA